MSYKIVDYEESFIDFEDIFVKDRYYSLELKKLN